MSSKLTTSDAKSGHLKTLRDIVDNEISLIQTINITVGHKMV